MRRGLALHAQRDLCCRLEQSVLQGENPLGMKSNISRILAIASAIVMGLSLPGCGKKSDEKANTLRFGMEKDFVTLDPANLSDPITFRIVGQIYESLLSLDENNQAQPALAESWKSNEAMDVWTFKIRTNVFFHESSVFGQARTRKVTPDDVVFSISRSVSPGKVAGFALGGVIEGAAAYMATNAPSVSGLRIANGDEVEIKLTHPEPYFPYRLTSPYIAIYPKEAVAQGEDVFAKSRPVGTGPYCVILASDMEILLKKNTNYWGKLSPSAPENVRFVVVGNEQLRQIELRNGKLDVVAATPGMLPAIFQKPASGGSDAALALGTEWSGKVGVYSHFDFNSYFIAFNTDKVALPIRRAVNLAIDRAEIASALTFNTAKPKWDTIPDQLQGYKPPFDLPAPDLIAAKKVLADAGLKPGEAGFELLVHELDSSETLGELVQARMKEIGINVTLKKVTFNEAMSRLDEANFAGLAMKFQYIFSAPEPILGMLFGSDQIPGANIWRHRSAEVDRLLASYAGQKDRNALNATSALIEKQVYEDAPAVFLYQARSIFLYNPALKNLRVNGHGIPLIHQSIFGGA